MKKKAIVVSLLAAVLMDLSAQNEHYEWNSLPFGGAGFVSGIITSASQQGVMYARTDVGGAYRWDAENESWTPITDFLGESEVSLMGVESIAIDPSSPNRVFMYCGTSYWNGGLTRILYSDDYGDTFTTRATVTTLFPAHGNDYGRQSGERLAVCPANGDVMLCGSRTRGLWKSETSGRTWRRMAQDTFVNDCKMSFVQYVDSATVLAGLLYKGADNLFISHDGGVTWTPLSGAPTDYMPHRCCLTPDASTLYVAYSDSEGPGTNGAGALMKYDFSTAEWTDISPQSVSFGNVSVAHDNPDRIMAVSMGLWRAQNWKSGVTTWGDQIWISRNAGKTWTCLMESGRSAYSETKVKWLISQFHLHWCGSAQIDPFDSNRAYFCSGNGIVATKSLWKAKPTFNACVTGLEETVPLNIVSTTGAPLVVSFGDYDGCIYDDVTKYASRFSPSMGTTSAIAVCARNVKLMMRGAGDIYLSQNGGRSWVKKNKPVTDKSVSSCAISAEGTILIARPSDSKPYYSLDNGNTWTVMSAAPSGINIFADPVNDHVFYGRSGSTFYIFTYTADSENFTSKTRSVSGVTGRMCVVDGLEGEGWLARGSSGLVHLTACHTGNPVMTTVALNSSTCIGAGKAKEEGGYPSLYIWGRKTATQKMGIYRSDDMGTTWIRINDDLHQFGGPGNAQIVSGDMNTYGRVYMSSVGRGVVCGTLLNDEPSTDIGHTPTITTNHDTDIQLYDLQGRRITSPPSARIFISGGKKYLPR